MRRVFAAAFPAILLLVPITAGAQHWNEAGPGRDLLTSTVTGFDTYRQRPTAAPATGPIDPMARTQRGPIPILDWAPPAAAAPQPRARPRPAQRRVARPPAPRDDTPRAAAYAPPPRSSGTDWDRTFAERERELDRLRRMLDEDRTRYERSRQPQLQ